MFDFETDTLVTLLEGEVPITPRGWSEFDRLVWKEGDEWTGGHELDVMDLNVLKDKTLIHRLWRLESALNVMLEHVDGASQVWVRTYFDRWRRQALGVRTSVDIGHPILELVWSPTNPNLLAFSTYAGLYIVDVDTGMFSNPVYGGKVSSLSWSPDGRYLRAYYWGDGMQGSVLVDVHSGDVVVLEDVVDDWAWYPGDCSPPDGCKAVFSGGQGRRLNLYLVTFDAR